MYRSCIAADKPSRFRWVACQLDFLGDCLSDKDCRDALGQLPPGLNESYMRILRRVPTGKEYIVQMILNFVAYANPKLDITILREALSVPEKVGSGDALDSQSVIREGSMTRLCRSLIRKSNDGRYYEFAHFSVKEFLEGEMMAMPEHEKFRVSESICELLLAKQCLKYLLFRDFSSLPTGEVELKSHIDMRIKQHPFYFYAAVCWPVFAKPHWLDGGLVDLARRLFQPKKTGNFIAWAVELTSFVASATYHGRFRAISMKDALDEHRLERILRLLPLVIDKSFTALHMAAALFLEVICSYLIGEGLNIDLKSAFGCPLHCAVQGMHLALDYEDGEGFIDVYHHYNYCPVHAISPGFGRDGTIKLLLKSGASYLRACSGLFGGQTLVTIALKVAYWIADLSAVSILVEAGHGVEEEDLLQFHWFGNTLVGGKYLSARPDGCDKYGLERLILCLGSMIDRSVPHFRLCQEAWSLAIEMGCEFVQDLSVDTRISLSPNSLARTIFNAIRDADNETLIEALKDPRADIANLTNGDNETVFEEWLDQTDLRPTLEMLNVLKSLLSAGMEVNRSNGQGLLPVHMLAKKLSGVIYDDGCCEALCDIIRHFMRKGTGCTAQSRSNQNVFHLGLQSIGFIKAVLEAETDENILTALRTQDDNGHTPIILALQHGDEDVALLLLETSNCDLESLRGSASVHALCVAEGTHRAFNFLVKAGVTLDTCSTGLGRKTILHHVGPKTSTDFALQLVQMFPDGLLFRDKGKLPLDVYLQSCIDSESSGLDSDVLQLLALPRSEELTHEDRKMVWESLALSVRIAGRPGHKTMGIYDIEEENTSKAIASLLPLGFLQSYEAVAQAPGILPLLESSRGGLDDLWPLSTQSIYKILEQTIFWESLRGTAEIVGLLKAAVTSGDVKLVELLLEHGVSVNQRIDEMSALEAACLRPAETSDLKHIFTLLLNHADASRFDEINPYQGQQKGLIHYLAGRGKNWQLEEFIKRGADVNLRTNVHIKGQPAIVQHLWERSPETAMTLLDMGASPETADHRGMDVALAATANGDMSFLLHLHTMENQDRQLNWKQTLKSLFGGMRGLKRLLSGANALHLAADNGCSDVLSFYLDKSLLTDVNAVSEEFWTPMHVAAFNGQLHATEFLYSRGGSIGLKSADGSLPLHLAVRNGHKNVVRFLIDHGSAMDADIHGLSPMRYAMRLQNQSILDCLATSKQVSYYQPELKQHYTDVVYAFEQALLRGDIEYCEMLRSQGFPINVDLPGQRGRSALMLAIKNTNKELIKWLLNHGVETIGMRRIRHRSWLSPLQAMIMRPALNDILPILLQKYESGCGSVIDETPSSICIAIQYNNNPGLKLLLSHTARNETTNS